MRTLRSGFLYLIIAAVVGIVAATLTLFIAITAVLTATSLPHAPSAPAGFAAVVTAFVVLLLAAAGIALYAIFRKIRPGMRQLSEVDSGFRICYTGSTLLLAGLIILVLGFTALAAELAAAGSPPLGALRGAAAGGFTTALLLVGGITALIGYVLTFVVGAFKLYRRYKNPLYMAAGILFAADAALALVGASGMLALVGYVLMYAALKHTLFSS